jgi:hypothetical protein
MSTIVTRAGKGSPLTNNEVDANFTNLNTDKLESADLSGYAELTGATFTGDVEGTEFIGSLRGNNIFKAQAGEALSKGDAIYISGISGNTPVVSLADANNAAKMPAFGVAADDATLNSAVDVVTYGAISSVDTSGFTLGDTLYVSTTPGQLVSTPPTGESSLIQNLGKVERVHASAGILFIAGAGRTNATPNLNNGNFFLGNGSNQSVSADFETSVTGIALPLTGGALTGAVTTNSTFDGRDVSVDGAKLDGIESGATADQTAAEIKTAYESNANTNAFTDADETKLDGIEASADVTDTTNVTAAGALMDSEVTNLAQVKAFDSADYATAAQGATADDALPKSGGTMTGAIAMGTSKITGLGDPTAAQDAATKAYVDAGGGGGGETLQETLAIGNTTTTDTKIQFRDANQYINSNASSTLNLAAALEVQLDAFTFDINANVVTSGDITVGDDLSLLSDNSKINFGADSDVTLTHYHNNGLILGLNRKLYFYDTSQYIHAPTNATLDINATNEIELNATLIDVNGDLDISDDLIVAGDASFSSIAVTGAITEDAVTLTGTTPFLSFNNATNFTHNLTGNTTYSFGGAAATGNASALTLKIIQDTTARTVTWPASVDWAGGTAPTLTAASGGVDVFVFYTIDGGTTYYGFTAGQAMA